MNVRYHALARQEVVEAATYYANVRAELGDAFLADIDAAVSRILSDPLQFERIRGDIRR